MESNQREFTRVKVAIHVELRVGGNVVIPGEIDNISFNGLLIRSHSTVPEQTPCLACIYLDGGTGGPIIEAKGQVVRTGAGILAIQFLEILGTEGMNHLQNLILYNSGHLVHQTETEFQGHVGLKPIS